MLGRLLFLVMFSIASHGSQDEFDGLWGSGGSERSLVISNNLTSTCVADSLNPAVHPYSEAFSTAVRTSQSTFYVLMGSIGVFLNVILILLVVKHKQLQTISILACLQVAALDLITASMLMLGLVSAITNQWPFGEQMCTIVGYAVFTSSTIRTLLALGLTMDRFLYVLLQYFYLTHKAKLNIIISAACWVFPAVVGILLTSPALDCYAFTPTTYLCLPSVTCNAYCSLFITIFSLVTTASAIIFPTILYTFLYCKARRSRRRPYVPTASEAAEEALEHIEQKSTVTFGSLILTALVATVPSLVANLSTGMMYSDTAPPSAIYTLLVIVLDVNMLLVITDPIVIMRNADVREVIAKIRNGCTQKWCLTHYTPQHMHHDEFKLE